MVGNDPFVTKKNCDFCNSLTTALKSQQANPTYKPCKDKKMATAQLAEILGDVSASLSDQKVVTDKRKATLTKESTKKSSKLSSFAASEEIKALDKKWLERFSRLEAMIIASTLQPATGQPSF